MIGLAFGLACGTVEFLLLQAFVNKVTAGGQPPIWMIPAKLAVAALFFVPCGLLAPKELYLCAISFSAVLVMGALVKFIVQTRKNSKKGQ